MNEQAQSINQVHLVYDKITQKLYVKHVKTGLEPFQLINEREFRSNVQTIFHLMEANKRV